MLLFYRQKKDPAYQRCPFTSFLMYKIVAQSFPNNEIRVTWSSLPHTRSPQSEEISSNDGIVPLCTTVNPSSELNSPPPLSLVPNSQTQRNPVGFGSLPEKPTTFGLNGKRKLIRQGAAMETEAPPHECLFLTGTLPGSTEDSFRAIAAWSAYIVHRLKSWIGTYAPGKYDFYCWEYQRRGALHLHYCVWLPNDSARAMVLDKFREWWIQILHRVGESCNTDMFRKNSRKTWLSDLSKVRAVAEVCRKSPARYLAKYLSKSASPVRGSARSFTPSRWWGTSRPLKALCDRLTQTIEIIEGGYHRVRVLWEEIHHACVSSDSVTYAYRHKVGSGHTLVSYPNNPDEKTWLLEHLEAFSPMAIIISASPSIHPFKVLKTVKIQQVKFFEQLSTDLQRTQPGLSQTLTTLLNWMVTLTPSTAPEPLLNLLCWTARIADLQYILQSSLGLPRGTSKKVDDWLNVMDTELNRYAKMVEESRIE